MANLRQMTADLQYQFSQLRKQIADLGRAHERDQELIAESEQDAADLEVLRSQVDNLSKKYGTQEKRFLRLLQACARLRDERNSYQTESMALKKDNEELRADLKRIRRERDENRQELDQLHAKFYPPVSFARVRVPRGSSRSSTDSSHAYVNNSSRESSRADSSRKESPSGSRTTNGRDSNADMVLKGIHDGWTRRVIYT